MVDLQFMKLPLSGDFSVFKLLFGMACAMAAISTVFASTDLVGPALATSLEASRGGVDLQPLVAALKPAALPRLARAASCSAEINQCVRPAWRYPLFYCWIGRFTFGFEPITQTGYGVCGVFWLGTYMALLDQGWLWWVSSVGPVPAALTGFAVGSLALFPGLPAAPFYTLAHFKCHTTKHNKPKSA